MVAIAAVVGLGGASVEVLDDTGGAAVTSLQQVHSTVARSLRLAQPDLGRLVLVLAVILGACPLVTARRWGRPGERHEPPPPMAALAISRRGPPALR